MYELFLYIIFYLFEVTGNILKLNIVEKLLHVTLLSRTSMVYYKFIGATNRSINDNQVCGGGKCPAIELQFSGNLSAPNGDCRSALYSAEQMALVPVS